MQPKLELLEVRNMCEKNGEWANEMMEIEDQVLEEMREDYRRRLAKRLQEKLSAVG